MIIGNDNDTTRMDMDEESGDSGGDGWSLVATSPAAALEPVRDNAYFSSWVMVADFLLFRGAEFFDTSFTTERTRFNPLGQQMMVLSYPARVYSGPLVVDKVNKITFETLLSALVQFARLTTVVAVQYERTRCVYVLGPAMERLYRELMALEGTDKNPLMHTFRRRYDNAKNNSLRALYGPEHTVDVYPDLARFPQFKPPARLSLGDGSAPLCCMYVHEVTYEELPRGAGYAYFLDLGCAIRAPNANTLVRLSMPDAFLAKHLAVQKTTDIHYDAAPDRPLRQTVRIGPVFMYRYASPEEARTNLVGKVAVTVAFVPTEPITMTATTTVSLAQKREEVENDTAFARSVAAELPPDMLAQQILYRDDASLQPITSGMGGGAGGGEPSFEDIMRIREQELETLRQMASGIAR